MKIHVRDHRPAKRDRNRNANVVPRLNLRNGVLRKDISENVPILRVSNLPLYVQQRNAASIHDLEEIAVSPSAMQTSC